MRSRGVKFILVPLFSLGLLACHPPKPAAPMGPPIQPPEGWRVGRQEVRKNIYSATFVPKLRTSQEKLWITILRKPEFLDKSADDLLPIFQPHFICKSRDLNVIKKDLNEIVFEEKDATCYGQAYRYTLGRVARGRANVSYYGYRADVQQMPNDHRDFVLKTLTSAPLDTSGPPQPDVPPGPAANASPAAASH
jgi:hypothetical protein